MFWDHGRDSRIFPLPHVLKTSLGLSIEFTLSNLGLQSSYLPSSSVNPLAIPFSFLVISFYFIFKLHLSFSSLLPPPSLHSFPPFLPSFLPPSLPSSFLSSLPFLLLYMWWQFFAFIPWTNLLPPPGVFSLNAFNQSVKKKKKKNLPLGLGLAFFNSNSNSASHTLGIY